MCHNNVSYLAPFLWYYHLYGVWLPVGRPNLKKSFTFRKQMCTDAFQFSIHTTQGWLGSRAVSVLDSGAEGTGFKSQPRRYRVSLRQTVHTHCASVHQAAKLVAALLRLPGVTAGLAESNGSLPLGLWLKSPAGWLPTTKISSGTLRSVIEYGLPFLYTQHS